MKLSFHGAAQGVTGSKHLLTLESGTKILLDCGLFQGLGKNTLPLNSTFGFDPKTIDILVLSHAHIDHCGLIPKLVKEGFKGKIYCTPATYELVKLLLDDSGRIQEEDSKHINKIRKKQGKPPIEPIYTRADAYRSFTFFETLDYTKSKKITPRVTLNFTDAGHVLGSACIHLTFTEKENKRLTFSGDVGRYREGILKAPRPFLQADYIILESTYGNKNHRKTIERTSELLLEHIENTCLKKKGKLIIPAFSLGRTQEILYAINRLELDKNLPNVPVYVDSPLSIKITETLKNHPEIFNETLQKLLAIDGDPFTFKTLRYIDSQEESKSLNQSSEPCVIISASGMADAGRVKHHIYHGIENPKNTILIVGYSEPYSLGGRLANGDKEVVIFGDKKIVAADIENLQTMSAHGDYEDLMTFLSSQDPKKVEKIFLVHGEYEVQQEFQKRLQSAGFSSVEIPELHQEFIL